VIRPGDPARRKAMKRLHILLILFILSGMTVWLAAGGPPSTPAARDAGDFPAAQAQKIRAFADTALKTVG
jgi:hypothetical protein